MLDCLQNKKMSSWCSLNLFTIPLNYLLKLQILLLKGTFCLLHPSILVLLHHQYYKKSKLPINRKSTCFIKMQGNSSWLLFKNWLKEVLRLNLTQFISSLPPTEISLVSFDFLTAEFSLLLEILVECKWVSVLLADRA